MISAGKATTEETARQAATLAIEGASPLAHNGYKLPILETVVRRTLLAAGTAEPFIFLRSTPMMRPVVLMLLVSLSWAPVAASAQTPERIKALRAEAESGDARAQYFLGKLLTESDPAEATRWFRKAAEQGQRNAQTSLGFAYLNGERGVAKD